MRALLAYLTEQPRDERVSVWVAELEAALKPRRIKSRKTHAGRENTSAVYQAVKKRAGGRCECCGLPFDGWVMRPELDHARGRKNAPETVENCWLLGKAHHEKRHAGNAWLLPYLKHATAYGYAAEELWAQNEIAWRTAKTGGAQ
jgi:hypothetical protein